MQSSLYGSSLLLPTRGRVWVGWDRMVVFSATLQCSDGLCCARYVASMQRSDELGNLTCRFCRSSLEDLPVEIDATEQPVETPTISGPVLTLVSGPLEPR